MATTSLIGALLAKFDALTAANFVGGARPARAFGKMPATDSAGAQLSAESGYVVLKEESQDAKPLAFGRVGNETHDIVWEIYFPSLGDCQTTAKAIRFNGGTPAQKLGLDGGTLPDLTAPPTVRDIVFLKEVRGEEEKPGKTGKVLHCVKVHHRVCLTRPGT